MDLNFRTVPEPDGGVFRLTPKFLIKVLPTGHGSPIDLQAAPTVVLLKSVSCNTSVPISYY